MNQIDLIPRLGQTFWPFFLPFLDGLKMIRIVWLYEFRGGINGWDLKILYSDLESWKKWLKKKWNGMEWFVRLESWIVWNSMEWNGMGVMVFQIWG